MNLVLLSGVLCDAAIWADLARPGVIGATTFTPDYRRASSLTEMARLVLASTPPRFAPAGHSMGARVALEMWRMAPERIERLALLNTGVHPVQPGEREKRLALVALGREHGIDALVDAWLPPMLHPAHRTDPAIIAPLRAMCRRMGVETFAAQAEALLARPKVGTLLSSIMCPTLVATARQDEWSPVDQHRAIADAIPHSTLAVFEDSGHMAPFEATAQVGAALQAWLDQPDYPTVPGTERSGQRQVGQEQ